MRYLCIISCLLSLAVLSACDLQPKIIALPDSIGEFISERYPALLADPDAQPEIYNSAASDYGVYASPDLYGAATDDDAPLAKASDYQMPKPAPKKDIVATPDDYLVPGARKSPVAPVPSPQLSEITVGKGDTLYSISRKYSVPVNDLAVMNNIDAPFALALGQKLKVPMQEASVSVRETDGSKSAVKSPQPKVQTPIAKLPKIDARSGSKFTRPVSGPILSAYGAKSNGLFNDGINISAARGAAVGAAENGVVAYAGNELKGMGNLVIIQHSGGWMTVYAHMDSLHVRRGIKVSVGQKIGTVGQTGKVDRPQLHFEIRKGTRAYDPAQYLKK